MGDFLASEGFRTALHLVGRIMFATLFVIMGMMHIMKLDVMTGAAAQRGLPQPRATTVVLGLMAGVGGVFVLLGWSRYIGAGLIALFLFGTAFLLHPFWKETDPGTRMNEMSHFMKDLALAGAALLVAFYAGTNWPASLGG